MDVFGTKSMLAGAVAVAALILSGCAGGVATVVTLGELPGS